MDFDWQKYLLLARHIQSQTEGEEKNDLTEAMQRTAVSRAYYAMFHFAEDFAITNLSYQHLGIDTHSKLQAHLWKNNQQMASKVLSRTNTYRKKCDYDKTPLNFNSILRATLQDATYLKDLLKKSPN